MGNSPRPSKAARKKKAVQTVITVIAIVILVLTAAVLFFRRQIKQQYANRSANTVQTTHVSTGSIRTTVSGSGTLASEGILEITVPSAVSIDTIYAEQGDPVEEGMLLASVNTGSVLTALSDTQAQLDELDEQLKSAAKDAVSSRIAAGIGGRVKAVYAQKGDDVASVMYHQGALALLSLDGYMAVDIDKGDYRVGDSVLAVTSDGKEYTGTVSAVRKDSATILVTDNGPALGDTVTIDGEREGTLYIHEPLKITGYAGTVSAVGVQEGARVYSSTTLFTLTDTATSANYNQILSQRAKYEDLYHTLVKLYKDGGVYAPISGSVDSLPGEEEDAAAALSSYTAAAAASQTDDLLSETSVLFLDPNEVMSVSISVDETDILSLSVGQEVSITVESIGEDTYTGTVAEIDTTAVSASGVTMYTAKITLPRAPKMLPGMTADLAITIEGVENALLLPEDAVRRTSATAYVYTAYDEENDTLGGMVEVTTGLSNGKFIEITGGLKEGDTIFYTSREQTFTFGNFTFTASPNRGGATNFGGSRGSNRGAPGNMPMR